MRIIEARPDPLPGMIAHLTSTVTPQQSLSQREPEEMFLLAFQRATGTTGHECASRNLHRAYNKAQE